MRTLRNILILLLCGVLAAGGYLWLQRNAVAERFIRNELARRNIPVTAITVSSISTKSIHLSNLELGEGGALRADSAELNFAYSWQDRQLGALDATLQGVEVRAQVQDGEVLLGGIEKAWSTALITLNRTAIALALDGDLKFARDAAGAFTADLQNGKLSLVQSQKNLLLPLQVDASASGDTTKFTAQGNFHDARKTVNGTFNANYALDKKTGTITWNTQPMQFATNGFTFAQLSPGFADGVATIASKLAVSGKVDLKPNQWTVTPKITILELPVDTLLASVFGEGAVVQGKVKGAVPIRLSKGGAWRIEKSRLINIGPMLVRVNPATAGQALDAHPQADLVKSALSNLQVETLTLDISSTDSKGGVKLDWHFIGRNPDLLGGKPVDLTLAVTLNVEQMWRSLQEVKRATGKAERLLRQ